MFKELDKDKVSVVEAKRLSKWESSNLLEKTIKNRDKSKNFVFYDGPATANGMPGVHHMLAKTVKDTFCKYKTMKGYKVLRKVGWDTHGLPVEVNVEKELGFSGKSDIEKYGIEKFNKKCRESVWENEKAFNDFTHKMGQFIDLEHPYITYDNNYIETEWWILKKYFEAGLIYDGLKILPYCPRCGTGLASHEVAQGYKEVSVNTVTVPFKLKNEDTYLLVWTTTPWTLIANVAVCVNSNVEYVKCLSKGNKFIVARKLADKVLGDDYEILESYKGKDLEYMEYEQLLPFLKVNKKGFYVTTADYVTVDNGTGIVHIAPAFGQDDYEVGLRYNLPVLNPVDEAGCYKDGPWKGRLVIDSNLEIDIIKYLKNEGKLFKKEKLKHNYPHCWRCKTPLIYYSKDSLYIKVTDYKDKIIEENRKVNWHPSYVGEKRFGNWLANMNDWAISRNRYWGTPIPLWRCSCGHDVMIGSRTELIEKATTPVDENIDLHRPYVDNVSIKCDKCGKDMKRISSVIDCWFDSGSMPFAQYHYPFENKELFESQFPADFIAEGIDQTRGWFYSLLVISTFVKGCSPYKNVVVNDLVLDKYGQKMHKSRGNAIAPMPVLEQYGADATRFFMLHTSPVWTPLKFDEDGIKEMIAKFFNTFRNTYNFFSMYANTDNIDPRNYNVKYENLEEIDKWIISKYNKLVKNVTTFMDEYDLNKVTKYLISFVSDDLSNWYIRRNRKRFWTSEIDDSKKGVYQTTYQILVGVCKLLAPICPFVSDEIYCNLTGKESVHLADYPVCDESVINEEIERRMDLVIEFISMGRNAREDAKIKVRQPLNSVILNGKYESIIGDIDSLIKEELNVKNINYNNDLSKYMKIFYKPNYRVAGQLFGKDIKAFANYLSSISLDDIDKFNKEDLQVKFGDVVYNITKDLVNVVIQSTDGYDVVVSNDLVLVLDTELNDELINEGIARETISKIQQLRKSNDFEIENRIKVYYKADASYDNAISKYKDMIMQETLALEMIHDDSLDDSPVSINGFDVSFKLEVVS